MADHRPTMREKLSAALPYVMPAVGGLLGIIYVNTAEGFPIPFLWVGLGIFGGWAVARIMVRLLNA
ncbi:MAG: hypothetical protein GY883_12390 [Shimia sp.]|nr:hypothetical protein [Shimia sp.]